MADDKWEGEGRTLEIALEKAAEKAPDGEHPVTISARVHRNKPGETGPNPISSYLVTLGGTGG